MPTRWRSTDPGRRDTAVRPGPHPNDLDVLVIGRPDRADVYAAAERTEQRLSLPVNPIVCGPQRWKDASDAFVQQVRSAPLVWVRGADKDDDKDDGVT